MVFFTDKTKRAIDDWTRAAVTRREHFVYEFPVSTTILYYMYLFTEVQARGKFEGRAPCFPADMVAWRIIIII